jgi:lysozyme family protein
MLITQSTQWQNFLDHVLKFEGKTSKDPRDSASKCAPFSGAYHTNKGITYCTFKSVAPQVGIKPINYERFLKITDSDVSKILYMIYYKSLQGRFMKPEIAFSMIEIAWASGPKVAAQTLQQALNHLGVKARYTNRIDAETLNLLSKVGVKSLFSAIWNARINWLKQLPSYATFGNGWMNRINTFTQRFFPA